MKNEMTPVTLEDELSKISYRTIGVSYENGAIVLYDDGVTVPHNENFEMHLSEDFILKIADAIKRHKGQ